jgi:GNAT superfamily N-acetyltransferase
MLIEYAKREEIPEIAAFIDLAWRTAYRHILVLEYLASMKVEERTDGLLQRFDSGQSHFFVMRDSYGIVGAAVFGKSITEGYPDDGEISAIYLRQDCVSKGHGRAWLEKNAFGYADLEEGMTMWNARSADEISKILAGTTSAKNQRYRRLHLRLRAGLISRAERIGKVYEAFDYRSHLSFRREKGLGCGNG